MLDTIPKDKKRRFLIFTFIMLPVLSIIGFFLGLMIIEMIFPNSINANGKIFVGIVLFLNYILCVNAAYKKCIE